MCSPLIHGLQSAMRQCAKMPTLHAIVQGMPGAIEWSDWKFLLAVSRTRTHGEAARVLGVDQSTVGRRLQALEKAVGARLVDRSAGGGGLNPIARKLLPALETLEASALAIERQVMAHEVRAEGKVRLATTEAFAARLLLPRLPDFTKQFPEIELELLTGNELVDLKRSEADLSVRTVRPKQAALVARRVGELAVAPYASDGYLRELGAPQPSSRFKGQRFVGYGGPARKWPEAKWLEDHASAARIALTQSSIPAALAAALAGIGIALLPCYLADAHPTLVRLLPPDQALAKGVWLVLHQDLQKNARIRAVAGLIADIMQKERGRLSGHP
jgi:DNA-binding transcriptional LysR family regulator